MKLNNAQKKQLKALGNPLKAVLTIGKDGMKDDMFINLNQALVAHELVKVNILKTSSITANEAAILLSSNTKSEVVSIVGRVIVLYKQSDKKLIQYVDIKEFKTYRLIIERLLKSKNIKCDDKNMLEIYLK